MRLFPGILVIVALLVAAPSAHAAPPVLTLPADGASFKILDGVLPQVAYVATLVPDPLGCPTGTWAIERRKAGGSWTNVTSGDTLVPALARTAPLGEGTHDVRAALRCTGDDPVFSAIHTVKVLVEQVEVPDPPDLPDPPIELPDPPIELPDPPLELPDPLPLPPNTGTVQLPDGGTIEVPLTGIIPVGIAGGGGLPSGGADGPIIPLSPSTDDTRLCMVALSDLEAVRDLIRRSRRAVRRRSTARRRAALASARQLLVQAKAAEAESCL